MHYRIVTILLLLLQAVTAQQNRAVPLLIKPSEPTGRIRLAPEGLAVLRAQKGPFGIVAAVGPTRTGKSTLLGRSFLRGRDENVFEIGGGVSACSRPMPLRMRARLPVCVLCVCYVCRRADRAISARCACMRTIMAASYTTGAHITSQPIAIMPPSHANGRPLPILLIDTEGFSGIGGRTSRTYEANLFGLVSLMSSVLIFNTLFPVDASTVSMLNRFASHSVAVLKELNLHGAVVSRRPPALIWVRVWADCAATCPALGLMLSNDDARATILGSQPAQHRIGCMHAACNEICCPWCAACAAYHHGTCANYRPSQERVRGHVHRRCKTSTPSICKIRT